VAIKTASQSVPQSSSSYTGGSWTPYGMVSPSGGMDLLHQSVQWNTEEELRQAQLRNVSAGGSAGRGGSAGGGGGGGTAGGAGNRYAMYQQRSALEDLIKQYGAGYGALQSETEKRYQQMLDVIKGTSSQQETDIRQDYAGQGASMMQGLARTGMANTTIAPTMKLGIEREQQSSLNRLADLMQTSKLGVMGARTSELGRLGEAGLAGKLGVKGQLAMLPTRFG